MTEVEVEVALGIDIGTGSTKAGLVDPDGRLLAAGRCSHPITEPRPGWSETDPALWLRSARTAVGEVLGQDLGGGVRPQIVAVGFSGQMHGVVACDGGGEPVRPAVLWSDQRAKRQLPELGRELSDDEASRLANPLVAGMAGPTMAALRREEPEVLSRVATVVQPKDWLRWRLTGAPATDPSDASATLLWDALADDWSPAACRVFGVDPGWLPEVRPSGVSAGVVGDVGAGLLGVAPGLPVATGAADTAAALLGGGLPAGELQLSTGTGGQLARLVSAPSSGRSPATHLFRSAEPVGRPGGAAWYEMAAIQNAGIAIDWALSVLGVEVADAGSLVSEAPIGAGGVTFLPYLTGERTPHLDADLRGGWVGLRPGTGVAQLVRSVFEGVAFALRDGLEALGSDDGVDEALLAGGGSTARWWQQMLADVLAITLVPHDAADASVRGAGLLAWSAIGVSIDAEAMVQRLAPIEPDGDRVDAYRAASERFRAVLPVGRVANPEGSAGV